MSLSLLSVETALSAEHIDKPDCMFKSHFIDDKSVHCEICLLAITTKILMITEIGKDP